MLTFYVSGTRTCFLSPLQAVSGDNLAAVQRPSVPGAKTISGTRQDTTPSSPFPGWTDASQFDQIRPDRVLRVQMGTSTNDRHSDNGYESTSFKVDPFEVKNADPILFCGQCGSRVSTKRVVQGERGFVEEATKGLTAQLKGEDRPK
ncbi:Hypothetical protein NTJ_01781 [Nesidiocoris tenuis]|uniref:LITAF domain-containing protein n=1 Tax=Nesidiocoris tenuis TaxID=355587 RepID=A0ABN7A9I4_9HEMI|nr:Hypothetical protein NTJ_01781 [Nesidiocoris tenuis]